MTKSFPAGIVGFAPPCPRTQDIADHRCARCRRRTVAALFDHIVSAELGAQDGAYDGKLTNVPPTGEARYQALADYAKEHGLDLKESVAYADSTSDLPMLEAVGFPVAVNAETKLAAIARRRGWLIEHWTKSDGAPNRTIPIGPRTCATCASSELPPCSGARG